VNAYTCIFDVWLEVVLLSSYSVFVGRILHLVHSLFASICGRDPQISHVIECSFHSYYTQVRKTVQPDSSNWNRFVWRSVSAAAVWHVIWFEK
jgi:hypothetical protein